MSPRRALVEFIGTLLLVLAIGLAVLPPGAGALAPLAIAATLCALIYAGGHVSEAHYNPAVTLAALLRGWLPARHALPYFIAQFLAAAAAAGIVLFLKPSDPAAAPLTIDPLPTLIAEALFTFALVFVILNVATTAALKNNQFYGLAIALTVLGGILAVGPISGAVFNPAVLLALTIMGIIQPTDTWPHLLGQLAGSLVALAAFGITEPRPR